MADDPASPRTALVLGGGSDIALAIVRALAVDGLGHVVLAVRRPDEVTARLAADPLPVAEVSIVAWDVLDTDAHEGLIDGARDQLGTIDLVVCAVGSLGHHSGLSVAPADADASIRTNFAGPAAVLLVAARALADQGHGAIVVLSSVAAGRARRSNFVYGSAKAGLDAFAQGLGDSLAATPVRVHIARPGFVVSKMTTGLDPAPLATSPEVVAAAVQRVLRLDRNRIVWVPPILGPAFVLFRNAPAPLWRRIAGDR